MKSLKNKLQSAFIALITIISLNQIRAQVVTVNFATDSVMLVNKQVFYTDWDRIPIDLDNNTTIDFNFRYDVYYFGPNNPLNGYYIHVVPQDVNSSVDTNLVSAITGTQNAYNAPYAKPHLPGNQINAGLNWKSYNTSDPEPLIADSDFQNLLGQSICYIGVKFKVGANWRYGYIKTQVNNLSASVIEVRVKGYAYEPSGAPITIPACVAPSAPINTTPILNLNVCNSNSTTLSASSSGTINWFNSSTSTLVLTTGSVFVTPNLTSGTYSYYASANTCTISATRVQITVTVSACTNLNEKEFELANMVSIYPNPTSSFIYISIENYDLSQAELNVFDVCGKKVGTLLPKQSFQNGKLGYELKQLNCQDGIYIIKLGVKDQIITKRVVLNKN
jgi:hypothetical protein